MLLGLFKKVAIADSVALIAQEAFSGAADGTGHLLGMYAFAIQIYCDFSGYSDIARGTSRLFGIELMRNFEQPYLSRSITEFWRRWHISLSSWLHDYLYVPLGGNKGGRARTYINLIVTMLLGGLWHGAAWTFVVWGGLHGLFLAVHRWLGGYVPRGDLPRRRWRDLPKVLATFHIVALLWIFFRAPDLTSAWNYLRTVIGGPWGAPNADHLAILLFGAIAMVVIDLTQHFTDEHAAVLRWPRLVQGFACAIFILAVVLWSGGEAQPFIYFQF
jgi:D-alanyl-lipoteichoic acid acyltransferase DltB (MBOAT superfamily)